jgi:hypothetical protein
VLAGHHEEVCRRQDVLHRLLLAQQQNVALQELGLHALRNGRIVGPVAHKYQLGGDLLAQQNEHVYDILYALHGAEVAHVHQDAGVAVGAQDLAQLAVLGGFAKAGEVHKIVHHIDVSTHGKVV